MPAYRDHVLVNARDIHKYVLRQIYDNYGAYGARTYKIDDQLNDLWELARGFKEAEDRWLSENVETEDGITYKNYDNAYSILEARFKKILGENSGTGLSAFSANYLNLAEGDVQKALSWNLGRKEVANRMRTTLLKILDKKKTKKTIAESIKIDEMVRKEFLKMVGRNKNVIVENNQFVNTEGSHTKIKYLEDAFQSLIASEYKFKDSEFIKDAYNIQAKETGQSTYQIVTEVDYDKMLSNEYKRLSFYPYFGLTEEQKEKLDNIESDADARRTWTVFKRQIASVANVDLRIVEKVLNPARPRFFMVSTSAELKGTFGEVQAGLILGSLFKKQVKMIGAGTYKKAYGETLDVKPSIDIIMRTAGFQIKNYSPKNGTYQLRSNVRNFNSFKDSLGKGMGGPELETLGNYIALRSFNQPVVQGNPLKNQKTISIGNGEFVDITWTPSAYQNFWEEFINRRHGALTTAIYMLAALNVDKIFNFSDELKNMIPNSLHRVNNRMENLFWVFGGEHLVRSSTILYLIYQRLAQAFKILTEEVGSNGISKEEKKAQLDGLNMGLSFNLGKYTGPTYQVQDYWTKVSKNYWQPLSATERNAKAPKLEEIYENQKVDFKMSIYIKDLLQNFDKELGTYFE